MHDPSVVGYRVTYDDGQKNYEAVDINLLHELLDCDHIRVDLVEGDWVHINDIDNTISSPFRDSEQAAIHAGRLYNIIISKEEFEEQTASPSTSPPAPYAFKINRDSWHYRFIKSFAREMLWDCNNLCDYTRTLLIVMAVTAFLGICATLIGLWWIGSCIVGIVWVVAAFTTHAFSLDPGVAIPFGGTVLAAAIWAGSGRWEARRERRWAAERLAGPKAPKPPKEPGFIAVAYRNFKEKTCIRITFD